MRFCRFTRPKLKLQDPDRELLDAVLPAAPAEVQPGGGNCRNWSWNCGWSRMKSRIRNSESSPAEGTVGTGAGTGAGTGSGAGTGAGAGPGAGSGALSPVRRRELSELWLEPEQEPGQEPEPELALVPQRRIASPYSTLSLLRLPILDR